ncbi:hypothetical protein B0H67DRAFT_656407 [Lasiosphaeris hirsuta]|uniref:Uncharacterized protein n=1 Tax=Lasiosphaeris hirsuta TaxID=260670 RepID=A0AA40AYA8_9PEZI|nr:hypothetical protein B0H67DRAFT_656407 [Lasiosphaeris hirsuta]
MASPIDVLDAAQRLHYNFIDGRLLVDSSLVSKPPLDISDSAYVKELFGDQYLLTFPSPRLGMSHMVARRQGQYRIYLGHRNGHVVIQAVNRGKVLEYVPSVVFSGTNTCDLPLGLVRDYVHWLDLGSGRLKIRKKPHVWRTRGSDWILEVRKRRAYLGRNKASLVGPYSYLAQMVAGILGGFEDSRKLVIFQPLWPNGTLSVELRNLDLSFLVNDKGLLECREVGAEVDPDQDAGTLYGFRSGLVLRAVGAEGERSILVPLGAVSWSREGIHVSVLMGGADYYVDTFRSTDRGRPYEALFKLALLAFSPEPDTDMLRFFAAYHHLDELRALQPPRHPLFADFEPGQTPTLQSLQRVVSATFDETDFATTVPLRYTSGGAVYTFEGDQEERLSQCRQEADSFADFILQQWPSPEPSAGGFGAQELDVARAMGAVLSEWRRMYRNLRLSEYSDAA